MSAASNPNPEFSQDRSESLTVTFSEAAKGWVCFKSFIQDNGLSLNSDYYTLKDGELWKHHSNETRNNFYNIQGQSFVDVLFNEESAKVKSFASMKYEGSQSKITKDLTDPSYFNNIGYPGWYVEFGITDLQASGEMEFKSKEGKWFSYMKGWPVKDIDGLNSEEFSFQGIDLLESIGNDKGGGGSTGGGTDTHVCYDNNCYDINIIGASAFQNHINNGGIPFSSLAACQASCGTPPPPPPPPPPTPSTFTITVQDIEDNDPVVMNI